jgi:hypothetical protein
MSLDCGFHSNHTFPQGCNPTWPPGTWDGTDLAMCRPRRIVQGSGKRGAAMKCPTRTPGRRPSHPGSREARGMRHARRDGGRCRSPTRWRSTPHRRSAPTVSCANRVVPPIRPPTIIAAFAPERGPSREETHGLNLWRRMTVPAAVAMECDVAVGRRHGSTHGCGSGRRLRSGQFADHWRAFRRVRVHAKSVKCPGRRGAVRAFGHAIPETGSHLN